MDLVKTITRNVKLVLKNIMLKMVFFINGHLTEQDKFLGNYGDVGLMNIIKDNSVDINQIKDYFQQQFIMISQHHSQHLLILIGELQVKIIMKIQLIQHILKRIILVPYLQIKILLQFKMDNIKRGLKSPLFFTL